MTRAKDSVRFPAPGPIPVLPGYDGTGLGAVLPGAARALGVAVDRPAITLPSARAAPGSTAPKPVSS